MFTTQSQLLTLQLDEASGHRHKGTFSGLVNKAVNKGGQFAPPERRKFGAGKSMTLKDLRRRDAPSIAALNCPRRHAAREKVPELTGKWNRKIMSA